MDAAGRGNVAKRKLSVESSSGCRITKPRRNSNLNNPSMLVPAMSRINQANSQGNDIKKDVAKRSNGDNSDPRSDEESEMSSPSSAADDTSEDLNSDDEDLTSSNQSAQASPADSDGPPEEDELIQVPPLAKKPLICALNSTSDLRIRLSSFIPQLQKANTDLQSPAKITARRLDEVADDEEHYIEMNLGLGVLREKSSGAPGADDVKLADSTSSSDDAESDSDSEAMDAVNEHLVEDSPLAQLVGSGQPPRRKPGIEEVQGG